MIVGRFQIQILGVRKVKDFLQPCCGGSKYPPGSFKTEGGRKTERWTTQQDGKRGARDSKPKATTEDQKQGRPRRSVMKLNYAILHKKGLE